MPEPLTLGVEEEYLLVDAHSGALAPRADEAVPAASKLLGGAVTAELNRCQIEVGTPVCERLDELERAIRLLRGQVAAACRPLDLAPMAAGTHPWSRWQDQVVDRSVDRYATIEDRFQILARQQVICGYHVHVTVEDREQRIRVMNQVRPWLPIFLALSANSPFWQGADSGYASYRTLVWQRWPMVGMPPILDGPEDYDDLVAGLVASEAIADATHLYWYVRPSARYPTLEFRICDVCLEPADAITLAGLMRALVWMFAARGGGDCGAAGGGVGAGAVGTGGDFGAAGGPRGPGRATSSSGVGTSYELRAAMWRAARYGLEARLIDPVTGLAGPAAEVVRRAVARLVPGLDANGDRAIVEGGVEHLIAQGNGAMWQRRVAAGVGPRELALRLAARTVGPAQV